MKISNQVLVMKITDELNKIYKHLENINKLSSSINDEWQVPKNIDVNKVTGLEQTFTPFDVEITSCNTKK